MDGQTRSLGLVLALVAAAASRARSQQQASAHCKPRSLVKMFNFYFHSPKITSLRRPCTVQHRVSAIIFLFCNRVVAIDRCSYLLTLRRKISGHTRLGSSYIEDTACVSPDILADMVKCPKGIKSDDWLDVRVSLGLFVSQLRGTDLHYHVALRCSVHFNLACERQCDTTYRSS